MIFLHDHGTKFDDVTICICRAHSLEIIMEKTTYSYCEKLFYTIKVSEVTGNPAIIHIRDETGKGSSAIPFPITGSL